MLLLRLETYFSNYPQFNLNRGKVIHNEFYYLSTIYDFFSDLKVIKKIRINFVDNPYIFIYNKKAWFRKERWFYCEKNLSTK